MLTLEKNPAKLPAGYTNKSGEQDWPGSKQLNINVKNKIKSTLMIKKILDIIRIDRMKTPLISQVEELAKPTMEQINSVYRDAGTEPPINKKVQFTLPTNHIDKCSKSLRAEPLTVRMSTARRRWKISKHRRQKQNSPLTMIEMRAMVLNGPSHQESVT